MEIASVLLRDTVPISSGIHQIILKVGNLRRAQGSCAWFVFRTSISTRKISDEQAGSGESTCTNLARIDHPEAFARHATRRSPGAQLLAQRCGASGTAFPPFGTSARTDCPDSNIFESGSVPVRAGMRFGSRPRWAANQRWWSGLSCDLREQRVTWVLC